MRANGTPSPIPLEEIAAAIRWHATRIAEDRGLPPVEAQAHARDMVRSHLLIDQRIVPQQWATSRCLVCGEPGDSWRELAPFCTPVPDRHLWMHLEPCHAEHRRRQAAKVEALLARALKSEHGSVGPDGPPAQEDGSLETTPPAQTGYARPRAKSRADPFAIPPQRSAF